MGSIIIIIIIISINIIRWGAWELLFRIFSPGFPISPCLTFILGFGLLGSYHHNHHQHHQRYHHNHHQQHHCCHCRHDHHHDDDDHLHQIWSGQITRSWCWRRNWLPWGSLDNLLIITSDIGIIIMIRLDHNHNYHYLRRYCQYQCQNHHYPKWLAPLRLLLGDLFINESYTSPFHHHHPW